MLKKLGLIEVDATRSKDMVKAIARCNALEVADNPLPTLAHAVIRGGNNPDHLEWVKLGIHIGKNDSRYYTTIPHKGTTLVFVLRGRSETLGLRELCAQLNAHASDLEAYYRWAQDQAELGAEDLDERY
jgi:hypothetical protein